MINIYTNTATKTKQKIKWPQVKLHDGKHYNDSMSN